MIYAGLLGISIRSIRESRRANDQTLWNSLSANGVLRSVLSHASIKARKASAKPASLLSSSNCGRKYFSIRLEASVYTLWTVVALDDK